jgi:hypothetical protein
MIVIQEYVTQFTPGGGTRIPSPTLVELRMPALYKPLSATVSVLHAGMSLAAQQRGTHHLFLTARVQEGPLQPRRFLVAQPGDSLPDAVLGEFDKGDPIAVQWNVWQGLYVPSVGHYLVFDTTHLKLKGYE